MFLPVLTNSGEMDSFGRFDAGSTPDRASSRGTASLSDEAHLGRVSAFQNAEEPRNWFAFLYCIGKLPGSLLYLAGAGMMHN